MRVGTYGAADSDYPNPPKSNYQPSDGGGKGKGGGRGGGGGGGGGRNSNGQTPAQAAVTSRRDDRRAGKGRGAGGKGGGGRKRVQHDYM